MFYVQRGGTMHEPAVWTHQYGNTGVAKQYTDSHHESYTAYEVDVYIGML